MSQGILAGQTAERPRLLGGGQIFALNILDERDRQCLFIAEIPNHGGNFVEAGQFRGLPAAFAGDNFELMQKPRHRPHHDRLNDAARLDRRREFFQRLVVDLRARLVASLTDGGHRQGACSVEAALLRVEKRLQPPTQPFGGCIHAY